MVPAVNAADLMETLGGRPPATNGAVISVVTGGPVEVALTRDGSDQGLRKAWRERSQGRATPVLVVHDSPKAGGLVRALGPTDDRSAVREIPVDRLATLLQRISSASRLTAAREVSEELQRLDEAGVPGLVVKDLLTRHLLLVRLRTTPDWRTLEEAVGVLPPSPDWRALLTGLGYALERRRQRGWLARAEGAPTLVVHPLADTAAFARLDSDGRPPEGTLAVDCRTEGVAYGALASGSRLRLFRSGVNAEPGAAATTTSFLELDAADLRPEDRPLLALLAPASLARGGLFGRLDEQARLFGAELRARLDDEIRARVLPQLAGGIGAWVSAQGGDLSDPGVRRDVQDACLTWVFRALFVLYAESSGYLPIDHQAYRANALTTLAEEAADSLGGLDPRATSLWDRFGVLVRALRTGDTAAGVPAYNGDLFAPSALPGAALLERASVPNDAFGGALAALGRDPATGSGVDYSSLEIGHLGNLYEGLLSLQLTLADVDLGLYARGSGARKELIYSPAKKGADVVVQTGQLFWQTHTGGRKASGVYYTPSALVEHLVQRAVLPSLEEHLDRVRATAETDPASAAASLFRFRVLDPACGSAHFLTVALHRMAERIDRFLAEAPLPAVRDELEMLRAAAGGASQGARIDHADLLHRLVLKRCVYGVDLSPMGAEVARLSLWLASFVPGLSLAYLGHNVQVGDALIGVADPTVLNAASHHGMRPIYADAVEDAIAAAAADAARLSELTDRTPDEVTASRAADADLHRATEGVRRLYDAWTAGPLGVPKARQLVETAPLELISGAVQLPVAASEVSDQLRVLHWPLAFPEVFAGDRPGFDVVIGNPPWEEVTVEELAFYARYSPRLRGLAAVDRVLALSRVKAERPGLAGELVVEQRRTALLRQFLGPAGGYERSVGDPDLYKFFCQRYRALLANGGRLGVVLPRSTFLTAGSRGFRRWLFGSNRVERIDFLLNSRLWMFETHGQYTVALLAAAAAMPDEGHEVEVAGVAASAEAFARQSEGTGIRLPTSAMGAGYVVPLLPSQPAAAVLATIQGEGPLARGGGRWRCFPVAEFHETADKALWEGKRQGWALWKGGSFDQHDPHGAEARWCPPTAAALRKARKPRPGADSVLATEVAVSVRAAAVAAEVGAVRLAFRDVSRATDSRTVRASLIQPQTFLTNTAPYLAFVDGGHEARAACCAVLNSLPFDWQARRFVETHVNFFILELLTVPKLDDPAYEELVDLGARLSCADQRFAEVAEACGVAVRPLTADERIAMRARVDALVAVAYGLAAEDMEVVLQDFTLDAVGEEHRAALRREMAALCS